MPKYLLDTNIIIEIIRGNASVVSRIVPGVDIYLPYVAIGELFAGAYKSAQVQANLAQIASLANNNPVLFSSLETARQYGYVRSELQQKGTPIPENDIWIAALDLEYNLALVTRDAHFGYVQNLTLESW